MSQAALARAVGVSQQVIGQIETGAVQRTRFLLELATALGVAPGELDPTYAQVPIDAVIPGERLVGAKNFPIYASVEGGEGSLLLSYDAVDYVKRPAPLENVRGGYGLIVTGESMVPAFRPGDIALVHPHKPVRREDVAVFYRAFLFDVHATIKEYVSHSEQGWRVKRYRPEETEFILPSSEWQQCHLVVGKYSR